MKELVDLVGEFNEEQGLTVKELNKLVKLNNEVSAGLSELRDGLRGLVREARRVNKGKVRSLIKGLDK